MCVGASQKLYTQTQIPGAGERESGRAGEQEHTWRALLHRRTPAGSGTHLFLIRPRIAAPCGCTHLCVLDTEEERDHQSDITKLLWVAPCAQNSSSCTCTRNVNKQGVRRLWTSKVYGQGAECTRHASNLVLRTLLRSSLQKDEPSLVSAVSSGKGWEDRCLVCACNVCNTRHTYLKRSSQHQMRHVGIMLHETRWRYVRVLFGTSLNTHTHTHTHSLSHTHSVTDCSRSECSPSIVGIAVASLQ